MATTEKKDGAQATEAGSDAATSAPTVGLSGSGVEAPPAEPAAPAAGKKRDPPVDDKSDDKPFSMTPAAWKKQIAEQQAKANEQLAKDLGYKSVDDMKTRLAALAAASARAAEIAEPAGDHAARAAASPADKTQAATVTEETPEQKALLQPMREKLRKETAAGRQFQAEARTLKTEIESLKTQFEVERSEHALRDVCRSQGVVGDYVDDVMSRLRKKLDAMSEEEINTFNEEEWIVSLRDKHPFYFGERSQPANAGHADRETPPKPGPAAATKTAGAAGAFNAMTASKKDVDARIAALGIPAPRTIN